MGTENEEKSETKHHDLGTELLCFQGLLRCQNRVQAGVW